MTITTNATPKTFFMATANPFVPTTRSTHSALRTQVLYIMQSLLLLAIGVSLFSSCSSQPATPKSYPGFTNLLSGNSLSDWDYDPIYWKIKDGVLTGEITPTTLLKRNSFIIKKGLANKDFELFVEYRMSEEGNSGINYRSARIDSLPYAMKGYQADIDGRNRYTGQNYEERGRTTLAYRGQKTRIDPLANPASLLGENIKSNAWVPMVVTGSLGSSDSLSHLIKANDWNEVHIIAKGNVLQHYVNGVLMSEVTDNDPVNGKNAGELGVQVHVGPPMKIEYRNMRYKAL